MDNIIEGKINHTDPNIYQILRSVGLSDLVANNIIDYNRIKYNPDLDVIANDPYQRYALLNYVETTNGLLVRILGTYETRKRAIQVAGRIRDANPYSEYFNTTCVEVGDWFPLE